MWLLAGLIESSLPASADWSGPVMAVVHLKTGTNEVRWEGI
jgi:hypothetical protein